MTLNSSDLKAKLSSLEYEVTQHCATEPAFNNKYWDSKELGLYVDKISGVPLFVSLKKFDSGSGWPSFTEAIASSSIVKTRDISVGMERIELKSKNSKAHLGHLFNDGPKLEGGLRYCINSASLNFIKYDDLKKDFYEPYLYLFENINTESIVLSGGCFWGMEELFRKIEGVLYTKVGYSGGFMDNPNYEKVKTGKTGHAESILINFDTKKTNLENILNYFFTIHDPTTHDRQGNDIGTQYRSEIFYTSDSQKNIIDAIIKKIENLKVWKKPLATAVEQLNRFYDAEEYHQKYLEKNPGGYTCHFERKF